MDELEQDVIVIFSADSASVAPIAAPLGQAGYVVVEALSTASILDLLIRWNPRMVIVDWNLPDSGAFRIIQAIRASAIYSKVSVVLAGTEIRGDDKVFMLESMIDYCLDGPIYPLEWIARVRAILRRTPRSVILP
jgi:DNA-binding response OmpR family regulator